MSAGTGVPAASPFAPEPARAARIATLAEQAGDAFGAALADAMTGNGADPRHPAAVVPATVVRALVDTFGLDDPADAAILALPAAQAIARPPVSGYHVGAAAVAADGDLLLGGNVEIPGGSIWQTIHGEGFVTLLARARGTRLVTLAITQARPCAHCRQVLTEMAGADELVLVDPPGRRLRLADLYPWPFTPSDLGTAPAAAGVEAFPFLALPDGAAPPAVADLLVAAGRAGHAPYSGSAAACVVELADGMLVPGTVLESVAFNPTIGPVQDAIVGVVAAGREPADITTAWVAVGRTAQVGHETMARDALAALVPGAAVEVRYWS